MTNAFQQLCMEISRSHHCQAILDVSLNNSQAKKRLSIDTHQSVYNVTISGAYQNVMLARGALIRNNPLKVHSISAFTLLSPMCDLIVGFRQHMAVGFKWTKNEGETKT